jgi:hypothetical protein
MTETKPLYQENDIVYFLYEGSILPICINEVYQGGGTFSYTMDYERYLQFMKEAKDKGLEDHVPKIRKGIKIVQEDLFKSMEDLEVIAKNIKQVVLLIANIEKDIRKI